MKGVLLMLPLNPDNLLNFSNADVDLLLAALYDFTEADFSAIWNKKRCRENRKIAFQIIRKLESRETNLHDGEIKLIYVALCFFEEYLVGLMDSNQLASEQESILHLLPYMQERFAAIMEHHGIVQPDRDG